VRPGQDFFPLTVNFQEKTFAAGKIPGGFFKREGRPAEKETLTSRLIDRPIRPLFPAGFRNETQVICTVLAHDQENDPDIVALIGGSAALTISGIPFLGPIAGARVGYKDGAFLLNPTVQDLAGSELDLVVAGTQDAVMMVESEAKELPEETMLGAVLFGQQQFQPVIDMIIALAETCAKEPWELASEDQSALYGQLQGQFEAELRAAYAERSKQARQNLLEAAKLKAVETLGGEDGALASAVGAQFKKLEKAIVRGAILDTGERIDGRDT
jgi:polyribonucleotide nucleotidyltransferase